MAINQLKQEAFRTADLARRIRKLEADQSKQAAIIFRLVKKLEPIKPLSGRLKRHIRLLRDLNRK